MPWKIYVENDLHCIHKLNADGSQGEKVACHQTADAAEQQLKALYSNVQDENRAEARSVAFLDVDTSNGGRTFRGYAAVYDSVADIGEFTESIARGAFRKALSSGDNVPMLYDHNPGLPVLATTGAGTLRLKEDARGLLVEADVAKHFIGDALVEMVDRGDIRGMSFGFVAGQGNSRVELRGAKPHRELLGFKKLLDVSPTWDPAYAGTDAAFRSLRALQMAESLEAAQQVLTGAYTQLEDGAPPPSAGTGEDEAEGDPRSSEEVISGVSAVESRAAARRRRLHMMALSLPKDQRT